MSNCMARFALDMARGVGLDIPTAHTANNQYVKALRAELGDEDFSAVYETTQKCK